MPQRSHGNHRAFGQAHDKGLSSYWANPKLCVVVLRVVRSGNDSRAVDARDGVLSLRAVWVGRHQVC